jgi:predicted esterase YcpF (UPF0227 family)
MTPFVLDSPGGFGGAQTVPDWVVYLHGFRSSSRSSKAQKVIGLFEEAGLMDRLWVPDLPVSPAQALRMIETEIHGRLHNNPHLKLAFVGSSLGGYYATVLGQRHLNSKVVLLNPAVKPYDSLADQTGKQTIFLSDEEVEFLPVYLNELRQMEEPGLTNLERYFLVAATGDEVLNYSDMVARYCGAHVLKVQGSDHALSHFEEQLPFVRLFLGIGD